MVTTLEDINRLRNIDQDITMVKRKMTHLRDSMTSLQIAMDGMPHSGRSNDKFADYVARMDELMDKYAELLKSYEDLSYRIAKDLDQLDPLDATIVQMKGIDGKGNDAIGYRTHYSVRTIQRRYKIALNKLSTLPQQT